MPFILQLPNLCSGGGGGGGGGGEGGEGGGGGGQLYASYKFNNAMQAYFDSSVQECRRYYCQ